MPVLTSNTHVTAYLEKEKGSVIDQPGSEKIYLLSKDLTELGDYKHIVYKLLYD